MADYATQADGRFAEQRARGEAFMNEVPSWAKAQTNPNTTPKKP